MISLLSRNYLKLLLLFFGIMFLYYFHNTDNGLHVFPMANISIENTLETIPVCESGDRDRQRSLLRMFYAWTQFAHEHNLRYWLCDGSLVGYTRLRGLIPHDSDVDVLMLHSDTKRLASLTYVNFSSIYQLRVHPQWEIIGEKNRSYFESQGITFVAPNARVYNLEDNRHVDIWPIYDFHPDQPTNTTLRGKTLFQYSIDYAWASYPIEWTFPLKPCLFSQLKTWCPAMPEKIVSLLYGSQAVNQSDHICKDGSWVDV
ncbi:hypothetical protein I4U23_001155 [Adineta vaga]|nr:hypothetical protein I4U23_001155 [Adineta vaga]